MRLRVWPLLIIAVGGVLAWSEFVHWRASWQRLGTPGPRVGREAIVVLGYSNRGQRANVLNRYRVRAAVRSISPVADESVLVLCGGAVGGDVAEADLMLRYARRELGYRGPILLDRYSRSTWQNVENAIPLIEGFDTLKIASNSLHAAKARGYLWTKRPDLARRLSRAEDYRLGEILLLKPVAAIIGLASSRQGRECSKASLG